MGWISGDGVGGGDRRGVLLLIKALVPEDEVCGNCVDTEEGSLSISISRLVQDGIGGKGVGRGGSLSMSISRVFISL